MNWFRERIKKIYMHFCFDRKERKANCPCTVDCPRKGKCCDCIAFHRERKELPACLKELKRKF